MIETITHYLYNIASFIGGCFAGGVGMHFYYKKIYNNKHITQKNINAGGDVAGHDINK
jgi:hypothetical protein